MPTTPDLEPDQPTSATVHLDARNLRGLAHPIRVRMLALLRADGPATATTLARQLGLNTGATSYHLRQLASHGFVVEEPDRGTSRERWWRSAHWGTRLDRAALGPDEEGLGWAYLRGVTELYAERMLRAVDELSALPEDWQRAMSLSDSVLLLTPGEARSLTAEIAAVIRRYRTADPAAVVAAPAGAAEVAVQVQAFPRPGPPDPDRRPGTAGDRDRGPGTGGDRGPGAGGGQ